MNANVNPIVNASVNATQYAQHTNPVVAGVNQAGYREWYPFVGPFDPCPPIRVKTYVVPPNQYIMYQPMNLPQFPLHEALRRGTLWPALYSPYESKKGR